MNNILFCPKCGSVSFKKDGFISKTHYQRYKCKDWELLSVTQLIQ